MGKAKDTTDSKEGGAAVAPPESPQNTLTIVREDGESSADAIVRQAVNPVTRGAITSRKLTSYLADDADITTYVKRLREQAKAVAGGDLSGIESMLVTQAMTLDALFNSMSMKALETSGFQAKEAILRLALKAQAQCASTAKVLGELKNPRSVAFIRQQNNANGHQQVNNGVPAPMPATESPSTNSQALEASDGEWMDRGAQSQASGGDPALEAVGKIDRTEVREG